MLDATQIAAGAADPIVATVTAMAKVAAATPAAILSHLNCLRQDKENIAILLSLSYNLNTLILYTLQYKIKFFDSQYSVLLLFYSTEELFWSVCNIQFLSCLPDITHLEKHHIYRKKA